MRIAGSRSGARLDSSSAVGSSGPSGASSSSSRNAERVAAPPAPGPGVPPDAADSATPSGHPLGGRPERLQLGLAGLAAGGGAHQLGALLDAEREVRRSQLRNPSRRPQLRQPDGQRHARRHRHAQCRACDRQQVAHHRAGLGRVRQLLGVVDHHHQRVHQQALQLGCELARRKCRIDLLRRVLEPLAEHVGGTRRRVCQRLHRIDQEPPRIAVQLGERTQAASHARSVSASSSAIVLPKPAPATSSRCPSSSASASRAATAGRGILSMGLRRLSVRSTSPG